jgi:putative protein kinase ArgK-like GTPase of G3E family
MELSVHERAYIRPSPSSGTLGGVAEKTREAMLVCEAAGYDVVIVETVGVGQSETAVAGMTDMFVLLQLPNAGDDLQAIKKGVMELADLVVINKADIDADARETMHDIIEQLESQARRRAPGRRPKAHRRAARQGQAHRARAHRTAAGRRHVRGMGHVRRAPLHRLRHGGQQDPRRRRGHRLRHDQRPPGLRLQPGLHRVRRRAVEAHAEKICKVMDQAMKVGAPVIGLNDSAARASRKAWPRWAAMPRCSSAT